MIRHILFVFLFIFVPSKIIADINQTKPSMAPIISYLLSDNNNLGRIMPVGDSITYDWYYGDNRPDSLRHAYRNHLWYMLSKKQYQMDFVGSQWTGSAVSPRFDGNFNGHTGWYIYQIKNNIYHWLSQNPADTVLLHIGTNDSVLHSPSAAVNDLSRLLNEIDRFEHDKHKKIHVILAKIIKLYRNGSSGYNWVIDFNRKLAHMAQDRIGQGDDIEVVNMESGAGLNYNYDLVDGIHPTNCGYEKMARVWFKALTGKDAPALQYCN